jgi:hypothetical protein
MSQDRLRRPSSPPRSQESTRKDPPASSSLALPAGYLQRYGIDTSGKESPIQTLSLPPGYLAHYGVTADKEAAEPQAAAQKEPAANGVHGHAQEAVERAASSSGAPLPHALQRKFESSLGADLSNVRIHTGTESAQAARSVSARAYTVGHDIHFNAGQYDPDSGDGARLIAHEVAHTVQQSGSAQRKPQFKLEVSAPHDASEVEADRMAEAMVVGAQVAWTPASSQVARVHRFVDPNNPDFIAKDKAYKDAIAKDPKDWVAAADALNGLCEDDIIEETKALPRSDLTELQKAAKANYSRVSDILVKKFRNDVAYTAAKPGQQIQDQKDIDKIKEKAPTYSTCTTYSAQVAGRAGLHVKGPNAYVEVNPQTQFTNSKGEKLSAKRDLPPGSWQDGTPGMSNRPKTGDMLVLMSRDRASFLHIDIFRKLAPGEQGENWTTVDGGGTTSTEDKSIFDPAKAELKFVEGGHRGTMALRGWFDVAQLAGFDDQASASPSPTDQSGGNTPPTQ